MYSGPAGRVEQVRTESAAPFLSSFRLKALLKENARKMASEIIVLSVFAPWTVAAVCHLQKARNFGPWWLLAGIGVPLSGLFVHAVYSSARQRQRLLGELRFTLSREVMES